MVERKDYPVIRNTPVLHLAHLPLIALRPFFMVTFLPPLMFRFCLHFMQYA